MAKRKQHQPRPPDILRKGGPMKDKKKYDRKRDKPPGIPPVERPD